MKRLLAHLWLFSFSMSLFSLLMFLCVWFVEIRIFTLVIVGTILSGWATKWSIDVLRGY